MTKPVLMYQMDVVFGEPEENLSKISKMLEAEQPEEDSLIVLPELFLTGYHAGAIEDVVSRSTDILSRLKKMTAEYGIYLFGSIPFPEDGEPFNTAILLYNGALIDRYQKSHLFGPMGEKDLFTAGRHVGVTDMGNFKAGMSICYDLRFPELYQKQAKLGANLLLICAEWPIQRIEHWIALARARAIENQCMVIACNRVGDDPDYHYGGHSVVFNSYGEIIAGVEDDEEKIIRFDINTTALTEFRTNFETAPDRWI